MTPMSYTPKAAIWLRGTGQRTSCIDSCQLTITSIASIKEVMVNLFLKWATYVHTRKTWLLAVMTIKTQVHCFPISVEFLWLGGSALHPFGPLWSSTKNRDF